MALRQKRIGEPSSTLVALAGTRQGALDGDASLCVLTHPPGALLRPAAPLALAPLLPPHRVVLTRGQGPTLSLALGLQPALAAAPSQLRSLGQPARSLDFHLLGLNAMGKR